MALISGGSGAALALATGTVSLTSGDLTTGSGTFVDATGITTTFTTGARRCLVSFTCQAANNTAGNGVVFDIAVDGARQGGTQGLSIYTPNVNNRLQGVQITFVTAVLTAASHTFKIQWLVGGTTGTIAASASSPAVLSVIELPNAT